MNNGEERRPQRSHRLIIVIVVLAAIGLIALNLLSDWLNETYNVNPAIANLANLAAPTLLCLFGGIYLFFTGPTSFIRWLGIGFFVLPLAVFGALEPVFDGDAKIVRLQQRFSATNRASQLPVVHPPRGNAVAPADDQQTANTTVATTPIALAPAAVDLKTETAFDFPRFLGTNGDATVNNVVLAQWGTTVPQQIWKQPIGLGWSGFSVVNGFAVTQEQRENLECVTCYELATGNLLWNYAVDRRHEDTMGMGKPGPRATPAIHQGRVYAMSATGTLDCIEGGTGELIWSVDVPQIVGIEQTQTINSSGLSYTEETSSLAWGRSTSPLIYKDMVIVPGGSAIAGSANIDKAATLIAFDKNTGETIWKGGQRMIAYGSPTIRRVLGGDQILLAAEDHGVGHDPETGVELWAFARAGSSSAAANCSQVVSISDDVLLFSKGYSAGGETVKIDFDEEKKTWSAASIAKDPRILKTKMTSPVIFQDHLYALSDGYLECVRIDGLKRKWKKRGRYGNGQLLLVGKHLLIHSESGTLDLVEANPEKFVQLGSIKTIDGICWNTICLSNNFLLVRSDLEAACYRLPVLE